MKGENMRVWVVVDIGCLECREETAVVGVFAEEEKARAAAAGMQYNDTRRSVEVFESEVTA